MIEQLQFLLDHALNLLVGFPGHRPGGLLLSIWLAILAVGAGFGIGMLVGVGSMSRIRPVRWASRAYVGVFRGLPLILLVILTYQVVGVERFGLDLSPLAAALLSLSLYSGAYQAEIMRSGLSSVPQPLVESARVLGSSPWRVFFLVKLRYAFQVMLPAFVGQAISLFKDTSVVVVIGVAELMTTARVVLGSDITNAPFWVSLYLFVGLFYFCVAFVLSRLASLWERRTHSGELVHSLANSG